VTSGSRHNAPVAPNRLQGAFQANLSAQKWRAGITFIPVEGGLIDFAVVIDMGTRLVVGWSLANHTEGSLVEGALRNALAWRWPAAGIIPYSGQGSQYACANFKKLLADQGVECSLRRKGNCWDNALLAGFIDTLRSELVRNARPGLHGYIEVFYNRNQLRSGIGCQAPTEVDHGPVAKPTRVTNRL
jgi:putative transposase